MERHADKQHGPLTFTQMEAFGDQLRIALESRQLPSVPPAKPKNAAPAAQPGDIEARLRKLEALPPKPPDKPTRGRGRGGRTAGRGGRGGAAGAAGAAVPQFKCLCCGKVGCIPSTCPHGNEEARREYKERKAAREAAREGVNAEKAMRRLQQGALAVGVVSEDEVSSEEENVDNCLSSPPPSISPPSSSSQQAVPTLGVIHYQMASDLSPPLEVEALTSSTDKENALPSKRIARITVAPILPQFLRAGLATYKDNVIHLYQAQCRVQPAPDAKDAVSQGAVVDTGAQRGAAKRKSEILKYTGNTHKMVGALGKPVHMRGIIMGCETIDTMGKPLTLIVPDESVSDASLTDSLLPVGRLKEAGFDVRFRIPIEAELDGVSLVKYPKYGGYIATPKPESRTIYMEYSEETWRLPLPIHNPTRIHQPLSTINAFSVLSDMSAQASVPPQNNSPHTERSEADQRRFELMCKRQQEAAILHDASGHRNPTSLVRDLKAAGIPVKHLQRYIHAHRCTYCEANLGRAGYQCQTAKQNGGGDLVISTIVDPLNPRTTITKTLADQHEVTSDPSPDTALTL